MHSSLELVKRCPKLSSLDLAHCSISDDPILFYFRQQEAITKLNIAGCEKLSDEIIRYILENKNSVDTLCIDYSQFNPNLLNNLREKSNTSVSLPPHL